MNIEQKLFHLAEQANVQLDRMDIGCTLYVGMTDDERKDLEAMINNYKGTCLQVLAQAMHDINGCRARHFKEPNGWCFVPRSYGWASKAAS